MHEQLIAQRSDQLGAATFTTVWASGAAMPVDEVTALILNG